MKHSVLLNFADSLVFKTQSQCTALSQYPFNSLTPPSAWNNIDPRNYAGDNVVINVVAGNVYEFPTMGIHGSTISYDTELPFRNATHALIAYKTITRQRFNRTFRGQQPIRELLAFS